MATVSSLLPVIQPYAQAVVTYVGRHGGRLTSAYRSYSDQLALWNNRHRNPYPVAPPGQSYHNYRRAFDVTAPIEVLRTAGAWWRSLGGTWSESDPIHFQA